MRNDGRRIAGVRIEGIWTDGDFVRLWTAGTVSMFGSFITRTALPFAAILVLHAGPLELAWTCQQGSN